MDRSYHIRDELQKIQVTRSGTTTYLFPIATRALLALEHQVADHRAMAQLFKTCARHPVPNEALVGMEIHGAQISWDLVEI